MSRFLDILERVLIIVVVVVAAIYVADYSWLHYRMRKPTANDPFDVVTVQKETAIPHKDGRYEFVFGDPQKQPCVHSIFPHSGNSPCWYVKRQNSGATIMTIFMDAPRTVR
jgi:hypothetical protein